jgi:hypothetical protein
MTDTADMMLTLASSIEALGSGKINETLTLNQAQRELIVLSLRHKAAAMKLGSDEKLADHLKEALSSG